MKLTIRETTKADNETIYLIEKHAFGEVDEADLTEKLLAEPTAQPLLSLLAFDEDKPVGHILFTKAALTNHEQLLVMIAILPFSCSFRHKARNWRLPIGLFFKQQRMLS